MGKIAVMGSIYLINKEKPALPWQEARVPMKRFRLVFSRIPRALGDPFRTEGDYFFWASSWRM